MVTEGYEQDSFMIFERYRQCELKVVQPALFCPTAGGSFESNEAIGDCERATIKIDQYFPREFNMKCKHFLNSQQTLLRNI